MPEMTSCNLSYTNSIDVAFHESAKVMFWVILVDCPVSPNESFQLSQEFLIG
jgi:hypothetical protein